MCKSQRLSKQSAECPPSHRKAGHGVPATPHPESAAVSPARPRPSWAGHPEPATTIGAKPFALPRSAVSKRAPDAPRAARPSLRRFSPTSATRAPGALPAMLRRTLLLWLVLVPRGSARGSGKGKWVRAARAPCSALRGAAGSRDSWRTLFRGLCCGCAARPERRGGSGRPPRASSAHRAVAGRRDAGGKPPWRGLPALSRRAGGGRAMGSLEEVGVCPSLHRPAGGKGALASSEGRALPSLLGSSFLEVQTRRDSLSYAALPLARRPGFRGRAIASCSAGTSKEEVSHSKSSPEERALGPEVHLGSHVPRPSWMALGHRQTPARGAECGPRGLRPAT